MGATVCVVVAARPPAVQEEKAAPAGKAATGRGLREQPLAAGRNKTALVEETQEALVMQARIDLAKMDCRSCHRCESPAKADPCLRICPRHVTESVVQAADEDMPDDIILLNAFPWHERRFMPVPFHHKLHSDMSGMSSGCEVCHHHSTDRKVHPPCRECHEPVFAKANIRMPALKGAYHRQCLGCHRDWSHSTKCTVCHLPKSADQLPINHAREVPPSPDEVIYHEPFESKDVFHFETTHEEAPHVTFRHQDHVERYGYDCEHCHKGQDCSVCHEEAGKLAGSAPRVHKVEHGLCFPCHEDDPCEQCHREVPNSPPTYFDHGLTGFSLGKYHGDLTCRRCHKRLFFIRKLEGTCTHCHRNWSSESFDHEVTGQKLDENHIDFDCEDCHADGDYGEPPACDECHDEDEDEDEGIAFPARRPGPVLGQRPTGE
jgi:hypothetical protein